MMYKFYCLAGKNEVHIDDAIGQGGITAKGFRQDLEKCRGPLTIFINSAGGSVTEGIGIYNLLDKYTGTKSVYIDPLAASMASVIAMAGDTITMPENALMMIHNPWGVSTGDAKEHQKTADLLVVMKQTMIPIYQKKTGLSAKEISNLMDDETWLTGASAKELNFADEVITTKNERNLAARMKDISAFRNAEMIASSTNYDKKISKIRSSFINNKCQPPANIYKSLSDKPNTYQSIKNV